MVKFEIENFVLQIVGATQFLVSICEFLIYIHIMIILCTESGKARNGRKEMV